ncbi:MAG: hypothetical protein AAF772_10810 [Acidobacteriota bacterium]
MTHRLRWAVLVALAASLLLTGMPDVAEAANGQKMTITGINYTKWLWGNNRTDGSLYNFTTIPGEGFGDNGQGTEMELLIASKPSKKIEVSGRLKARFSQNFWTNFGGFGGINPAGDGGSPSDCVGGDCGEFDPRSAQYVKYRGLTVTITPGYKWLDTVTIGSNDFGMFDPFTIGKIRYIDRDNGSGILFQGSNGDRSFAYDFVRVSLPRLWAGPNFETGQFTTADAAYALQLKFVPSRLFDATVIYKYVNDIEIDSSDINLDDGRDILTRFRNSVVGLRVGFHPSPKVDVRAVAYSSSTDSDPALGAPGSFFGLSGFSPVPAGKLDDESYRLNVDLNDPFGVGLSFNLEYFDIGADYVSMMAARRESDVLITEGYDGTYSFVGPNNATFGVFPDNPSRIGFGGWQGNMQQVATINVDNEFTDFDETAAQTVIGWKGFTIAPSITIGDLDLSGEYTYIDYNTNWQAFGDDTRSVTDSVYPVTDGDSGFGSYRSAYSPFREKESDILALKAKLFVDVGTGLELFGKVKFINEEDKRLNEERFLPYLPGDCPGGGVECSNNRRFYNDGLSVADIYGNPPVITVNGVTGYQWKPFDSLSDDDRDMDYTMFQLGAGYQLTDELYATVTWEHYDVDLQDGNTAFQAYNLHQMASGDHTKDKLILTAKYIIGGAEFGFNYEYSTGEFEPDFGGGFVPTFADENTASTYNVPVGSPGFFNRFGGWNSLATRDFEQSRLKAFLKVLF